MTALADVRYWLLASGIHHILMFDNPGSALRWGTACGTVGNVGRKVKFDGEPHRICRKCRAALPDIVKAK